MHVKESVKEFVHDVKHRFSPKRKRESCATCTGDDYDYSSISSTDSISHLGARDFSVSSSSLSSLPGSPERSRFIPFVRPRTASSTSKKSPHNLLHKVKRGDSKRYRLFSSERSPDISESSRTDVSDETQLGVQRSSGLIRDGVDERGTNGQSQYTDVIDISARSVCRTGSVEESTQFSSHDSSLSNSLFDRGSHSDTSGTLVTVVSATDHVKSASESDSRLDSLNSHSAQIAPPVSTAFATPPTLSWASPVDFMPEAPDVPPKSDQDVSTTRPDLISDVVTSPPASVANIDNPIAPPLSPPVAPQASHDMTPTASIDKPAAPVIPQASHDTTPAQPITSTSASPAPVYIPRLAVPSMFLPIPNTDPLSALLTKYVPAEQRPHRDVAGEYAGRDVHEMVMSNSWRALAKMARDRIIASDPEDLARILDLWSLRLSSLARLRLTNQASAECTNLFAVLNAVPPTSVPGSFPGLGTTSLPGSPAPAASLPLSPSGLSGLTQLPGTPSQKPSTLPPLPTGGSTTGTTPRHGSANELVDPFELTVFHARVHYWTGDPLGYVDALSRILARCKEKAREEGRVVVQRRKLRKAVRAQGENDMEDTNQVNEDDDKPEYEGEGEGDGKDDDEDDGDDEDEETTEESTENTQVEDEDEGPDDVLTAAEANLSMWLERIARVCLILASQMIEMNDYQAAINLLVPLCTYRTPPTFLPIPSPALHSALARIYLLSGNLQKAEEHFSIAASTAGDNPNGTSDIAATNAALLAAASGDWTRAEETLGEIVTKDPGNFTAINNLAVTLLCQGRIKEGIDLLEAPLKTSPSSVVVAEPFLFNLSTLYELRSAAAIDKKRELLIQVAEWSGDGLKTSCLKMPSS